MSLLNAAPVARSSQELAGDLTCPYCRSDIDVTWIDGAREFGVMRCSCGEAPVIEGIPWLERRKDTLMREGPARGEALRALQAGNPRAAVVSALCRSGQSKARKVVTMMERLERPAPRIFMDRCRAAVERDVVLVRDQTFWRAVGVLRNGPYADYLRQRFANPSLLASVPVMLVLKELSGSGRPRVLEIGGGTGHASFLMSRYFPGYDFTLTDGDFTNLYLARRFVARASACMCIDGEARLPFADESFDAVYCQDSFHYMTEKAGLVDELRRVVKPGGLWLFPHLHNSLCFNRAAGFPLPPEDYARLFSFLDARLYPDVSLLRQLHASQGIDLTRPAGADELRAAHALTLIAGRASLWRKHDFGEMFLRPASDLGVNPIYRGGGNGADATLAWPNADLRSECESVEEFMPARVQLDASLLNRMKRNELASGDRESISRLIRDFVLVPLPPSYGPVQATSIDARTPSA